MAFSNPQQFDEPVDEMGYKCISHSMNLVRKSHEELLRRLVDSHNELSGRLVELKEGLCLLAKKTVEMEDVIAEKIVELEQGVLLGEKEVYQVRQELEMVQAALDARGLCL